MIFKCKICGGNLDIQENNKIITCEYCGTKQTLPKLENDKITNLYDRANHLRRNNEYDKAEALYEMILNEDSKDAEAYWSLILCKFGVEYVEDPKTHEYIPTCNRTQSTSILTDENYKKALEYANDEQQQLYKNEAFKINEIQKGILDISQKEEPYDVFICYKETDENKERTKDSVLAQDIYKNLIAEGLKVFFARITLEDKIGTAYEPYIFSALNSAKVMLVVGTSKENFNAVWVRNEWTRYLALTKSKKDKVLIPCYEKMDAYDLPEEFAHLQAQDASKIGFMQDLVRGVKKIIDAGKPKVNGVVQTNTMSQEQKEGIYKTAKKDMGVAIEAKVLSHREKKKIFKGLAKDFEKIGDYEDAINLAKKCTEHYQEENRKSKMASLKIITVFVIIIAVIGGLAFTFYIKPNKEYNLAKEKYDNNEYYSAIKAFTKMGNYKDSEQLVTLAKEKWKKANINTVSGEAKKAVAVKEIGTVINFSSVFNEFSGLQQVEMIGEDIFGLTTNGKLVVALEGTQEYSNIESVKDWTNIVAIKASNDYLFGLKDNGTVLCQRYKEKEKQDLVERNKDKDIDTSSWQQIVQIQPCLGGIVGLKEDGTLVQSGVNNSAIVKIGEWKDIVQLTGANRFLIGLKEDGTLVGTSEDSNILKIQNEKDVIALSSNYYYSHHFAFVTKNRIVKAIGDNEKGQCDVVSFDNIAALYAGDAYTIGVTKDKKAMAKGEYNDDYYKGVNTWTGIKLFEEWRTMK